MTKIEIELPEIAALTEQVKQLKDSADIAAVRLEALEKEVAKKNASQPVTPPKQVEPPSYRMEVDGEPVHLEEELDPWLDGTRVFTSPKDPWYTQAWVHPDHVRLTCGSEASTDEPVTIAFYDGDTLLGEYELDGFTAGQEFSHHIGARAFIRTPQDLIEQGYWPRVSPAKVLSFDRASNGIVGPADVAEPSLKAVPVYEALKANGIDSWMANQGAKQEMHSSTYFARWALWPDSENVPEHSKGIFVTAESAAGFTWHKMVGHAPVNPHVVNEFERLIGNIDDFEEQEGKRHGFAYDGAHLSIGGWEMYLLTGDPYYLRQWQMGVIASCLLDNPSWRAQGFDEPKAVVNRQQARAHGKGLMLLLRLAKAMEGLPNVNWLQPKPVINEILHNTGKQALWLAEQPGTAAGNLPQSWVSGQSIIWGIGHSSLQALWSLGWAVHLGYKDFEPLFERMSEATIQMWDAYGGQFLAMGDDLKAAGKSTLTEAIEAVPGDPTALSDQFVWREVRAWAIPNSLAQWHGGEWTRVAGEIDDMRLRYQRRHLEQKHGLAEGDDAKKYSGLTPDWMISAV